MLTLSLAVFQDLVHTSAETLNAHWTLEMQQYIVYCILYRYIVYRDISWLVLVVENYIVVNLNDTQG